MMLNSVEGAKPGSVIGSVRAHDQREVTSNGQVTYLVVGGTDHEGTFMVDRLTGDVYLARELDYEKGSHYTLQIEVDDFSKAYLSTHMVQLEINVQDSNDHAPEFPEDPVTVVIPENIQAGSSIYTFQATDKDGSGPNSEIRYSIQQQLPDIPDLFSLDPVTGVLKLGRELDHEETSSLFLVVHATDSASDRNQRLWGSVTARMFVTDENDNAPIFSSPTAVSVMEDQPVGFVLLYVMARDADQGENGRVSYRIQSGNTAGRFGLSSNSGKTHYFTQFEKHLFLTPCVFMGRSLKSWSNLAERVIFLNGLFMGAQFYFGPSTAPLWFGAVNIHVLVLNSSHYPRIRPFTAHAKWD